VRALSLSIVIVGIVGCTKGEPQPDKRIAREFHELWDTRAPAFRRTGCENAEAVYARMTPFVQLVVDASKVWSHWDDPLPGDLAKRLDSIELSPTTAADLRCLIQQPTAPGRTWSMLGIGAALLVHKGGAALERGDASGWSSIAESLRMFRDAPAQVSLYFFQPAWIFEQASALSVLYPPDAAQRTALVAAAREAMMSQSTFCAGLKEELIAHGASVFYGHVAELRADFIDRWGPELGDLYQPDFARRSRPSYATWQAFRALEKPIAGCTTMSMPNLRAAMAPSLEQLKGVSVHAHSLMSVALSRSENFEQVHTRGEAFVAKVASAGG
jgi:hypothetical protein